VINSDVKEAIVTFFPVYLNFVKAFDFHSVCEMMFWCFVLLLVSYINVHVSDITKAAESALVRVSATLSASSLLKPKARSMFFSFDGFIIY